MTQPEATLPPKEYADGEVTVATGDGQNVTVTYTKDGEVTLDGAEGDVAVGRDTIEIDFGDDDGKVVLIDRETGEVTRSDTDTFGAAVQPTCDDVDADGDGDGTPDCDDATLSLDVADGSETKTGYFYRAVAGKDVKRRFARVAASGSGFVEDGVEEGKLDLTVERFGSASDAGVEPPTRGLKSAIVSIDAESADVDIIDTFSRTVELCLPSNSDDGCLAFWKASDDKWECVDDTLSGKDDSLMCGRTNHFTFFAVIEPSRDELAPELTPETDAPSSTPAAGPEGEIAAPEPQIVDGDRKSTRLNSSHR